MSPTTKPPRRSRRSRREVLDEYFPTILRYAGLVLMVYAALVDMGRNPALIPAATGMIVFKTIYGAGDGRRD